MNALLCSILLWFQEPLPQPRVEYTIDATPHAEGMVRVQMLVTDLQKDSISVALPAWAPGSYRLTKNHERISEMKAQTGNELLEISTIDPRTWQVRTAGAPSVTLHYTLRAPDSPRGGISVEHCDLQGPATYLYVVDHLNLPATVRFTLPEGWKTATGLEQRGDAWFAPDYDTLVDCPVELGTFDQRSFELDGATYDVVAHAAGEFPWDSLLDVCRKTAREQTRLFGGSPYKRYVFLFHFRRDPTFNSNGLEHLNSTSITFPYEAIRVTPGLAASLISHEFFHLWNVKRIRPKVLGPFDYTQPVRTRALWMCEGVTSYYGDLTLVRSNLWNRSRYLRSLSGEIEHLQNHTGRQSASVEEASWKIWDPDSDNRVSYYNKGLLVGLLLDLEIRHRTENRKSLDDVMRHLYEKYVVGGGGPIGVGYEEEGILHAINDVSCHDFTDFFQRYVSGVEELPYADILDHAGLRYQIETKNTPLLGIRPSGTIVRKTSPGFETPFLENDRILSVNDTEVTAETLREVIRSLTPDSEIPVVLERGGERIEVRAKVFKESRAQPKLEWAPDPTELQLKIRESWMTGTP